MSFMKPATLDFIDGLTGDERVMLQTAWYYYIRLSEWINARSGGEYFLSESAIPKVGGMVDAAQGSGRILPGLVGLIQKMLEGHDGKPTANQIYVHILGETAKLFVNRIIEGVPH